MNRDMPFDRYFLFLLSFHTALLISSNAAGSKIFALPFGFSASATVISYMASFIILDSAAELYGKVYSRMMISLGLTALIVSVVVFELAIALPPASFWTGQQSFETTLGSSWRIVAGGWASYIISQNLDLWTFFMIKKHYPESGLWLRALLSTLLGQFLDTIIFIVIAFAGTAPIFDLIFGQYFVKVVMAGISLPLVLLMVHIGRLQIKKPSS